MAVRKRVMCAAEREDIMILWLDMFRGLYYQVILCVE